MPQSWRFCLPLLLLILAACTSVGGQRLDVDHRDYMQAVATAEKEQTLMNIVRLRYADVPNFLQITQVISGYTLQGSLQAGMNGYPSSMTGNFATLLGEAQFQDHPTFTFAPVTGSQYADSFLRPFSPAQLLPLAESGLPIDVIFRLAVQSIGSLQNSLPLSSPLSGGSPDFFRLLARLRTLQENGAIGIRYDPASGGHVYLDIGDADRPDLKPVADEARRLLRLPQNATEAEVVYGRVAKRGQVAILTRSVLSMLFQVGAEIQVPAPDARDGDTVPAIHDAVKQRPIAIVHAGPKPPSDSYASVKYNGQSFWIDQNDFDSKVAFTTIEILRALAASGTSAPGTVVTIPAR